MAEETLGFYVIILPVIVGLGYDRMVGVGIIMVGAGVGTLASTVNPFATGVASHAAGVALGDGIGLRLIMYAVVTALAVVYVLWYARRVKADPAKSMVPAIEGDQALAGGPAGPPEPMTGRQKTVLWIFGLTFALMIFSVIPWGDFSASLAPITLGWYFPELAALFLVGAVLVGLESVVSGLPSGAFAVVMYLVNIPLAFLVPSSSGHATLAMPIMAPLGDFAGQVRWATYNSQLQQRIDAATATGSCAALQVFLTAAKNTSRAHEKATGLPNDALVSYIQAAQHRAGCPAASDSS